MEEVQNTQGQIPPKPDKTKNVVEKGMGNEQRQGQKQLEEPPAEPLDPKDGKGKFPDQDTDGP